MAPPVTSLRGHDQLIKLMENSSKIDDDLDELKLQQDGLIESHTASTPDPPLSAGAIAGIVLSAIFMIALIGIGIWLVGSSRRRRRRRFGARRGELSKKELAVSGKSYMELDESPRTRSSKEQIFNFQVSFAYIVSPSAHMDSDESFKSMYLPPKIAFDMSTFLRETVQPRFQELLSSDAYKTQEFSFMREPKEQLHFKDEINRDWTRASHVLSIWVVYAKNNNYKRYIEFYVQEDSLPIAEVLLAAITDQANDIINNDIEKKPPSIAVVDGPSSINKPVDAAATSTRQTTESLHLLDETERTMSVHMQAGNKGSTAYKGTGVDLESIVERSLARPPSKIPRTDRPPVIKSSVESPSKTTKSIESPSKSMSAAGPSESLKVGAKSTTKSAGEEATSEIKSPVKSAGGVNFGKK